MVVSGLNIRLDNPSLIQYEDSQMKKSKMILPILNDSKIPDDFRGVNTIMMSWEYLVALDINSIHEFIFGTNKLKEIRGASILLDTLNRKIPIDELKKYGIVNVDYRCILAGGGNLKVLFADKTKAEQYQKYLIKTFKDKSNVKFTTILSERKGELDNHWIKRIERELHKAKNLTKETFQIISSGFFKSCQACGQNPAEEKDRYAEEDRFICKSCSQKMNESRQYKKAKIYERFFQEVGLNPTISDDLFPSDFNEIGQKSEPKGYIGFIYADGNRMGECLEKIKSFDDLESFSESVDDATIDATVKKLAKHFIKEFPFQIILAGGDDIILALPAHKAVDVAIDFCKNFENMLSSRKITISASIVICHDSMPIKDVLSMAESLIKNAKAESRKQSRGSYLDFAVLTGSSLEDPIKKRKNELEFESSGDHCITKRPYSLRAMEELIINIKQLKKAKFPSNKLNRLYQSLFKGHNQSILEGCYLRSSLEPKHKKLIDPLNSDKFPWKETGPSKYTTSIGDIKELYEFIEV
jgi:hypothetical protein